MELHGSVQNTVKQPCWENRLLQFYIAIFETLFFAGLMMLKQKVRLRLRNFQEDVVLDQVAYGGG